MSNQLFLDINLDPTTFALGNYNVIIDNGGRYNKFIINTNIGEDIIDDEVSITYGETLVVGTYIPPDVEALYGPAQNPCYNGYYGWPNAIAYTDLGSGQLISQANFPNGINGEKPYSNAAVRVPLNITVEGYYVFDLSITTTTSNTNSPVLYLINATTNYIVASGYAGVNEFARIFVYLYPGTYNFVPTGLTVDSGAVDAVYHIYGAGDQFNTPVQSYDPGYSIGTPVDPDFNFNVAAFKITFKNLEKESTVNVSFCDHNFNELVYVLPSLIYNTSGNTPILLEQSSNLFRTTVRIPSSCCFANKITLNNPTICSIPAANKVPLTILTKAPIPTSKAFVFGYTSNIDNPISAPLPPANTSVISYSDPTPGLVVKATNTQRTGLLLYQSSSNNTVYQSFTDPADITTFAPLSMLITGAFNDQQDEIDMTAVTVSPATITAVATATDSQYQSHVRTVVTQVDSTHSTIVLDNNGANSLGSYQPGTLTITATAPNNTILGTITVDIYLN